MPDPQTPQEWIASVQARLISLVDNRPYWFKNTTWALAQQHLAEQKEIMGFPPDQIQTLEASLGVHLPPHFRAWVETMGVKHGLLFWGSDCDPRAFSDFRQRAEELIKEAHLESFLTDHSVVFFFHQGHTFKYFDVNETDGGPVWEYMEQNPAPRLIAPSFQEFIEDSLSNFEWHYENERNKGGYYLTITREMISTTYPHQKDKFPLPTGDRFSDIQTKS